MRRLGVLVTTLGLLFAVAGPITPAGAAPGDPDTISGRVLDAAGLPMANACVAAIPANGDLSGLRGGENNADGTYEISGLDPLQQYYVASVPNWSTPACDFSGPPPIPTPGQIQPVFYNNVYFNLTTWLPVASSGDPIAIAAYLAGTGASPVSPGKIDIDQCLTNADPSVVPRPVCAAATGTISGTVLGANGVPYPDACVVALPSGSGPEIAFGHSDATGAYSIPGIVDGMDYFVIALEDWDPGQPCGSSQPPPIPADAVQPVIYRNVWVDVGHIIDLINTDPSTLLGYLQSLGPTMVRMGAKGVDACLTTAPSTAVPRPACVAPASTTTAPAAATLPRTGSSDPGPAPLVATGLSLGLAGLALVIGARRRRRPAPNARA